MKIDAMFGPLILRGKRTPPLLRKEFALLIIGAFCRRLSFR